MTEMSFRQSRNSAGRNHLVQQIYTSSQFDLDVYYTENIARGGENLIKYKHLPEPRR